MRRRSPFLLSWMLASLGYEVALYRLVMPHAQAQAAARRLPSVAFIHVLRHLNKRADQLANEAMDQRRSWATAEDGTPAPWPAAL